MNPNQCRAARALVGMTREQLAAASQVSVRTIAHFESGERQPIRATLAALKRALNSAGVEFTSGKNGGYGVRYRAPRD